MGPFGMAHCLIPKAPALAEIAFKAYNQGERLPAGIKLVPAGTLADAGRRLAGRAEKDFIS